MLSIFIMLVIAIALCAGIGYSILTLIKSGEVSLGIQKNQVRMERIAEAIRSNIRFEAGSVLIPVDVVDGKPLNRVPMVSPFTQTAYGKDIVYCPVSDVAVDDDAAEGDAKVMSQGGIDTYDVRIREFPGDRTYVSAGSPGSEIDADLVKNGVVALLISPAPNTTEVLSCEDVKFDEELGSENFNVLIDGGSVTPVFVVNPDAAGLVFSLPSDEHPTGSIAVAGLGDAIEYIKRFHVLDATILVPEDQVAPIKDVAVLADVEPGRTIRLKGDKNPTIIKLSGSTSGNEATISFNGRTYLENVALEGDGAFDIALVATETAEVYMYGAGVGRVVSDGGKIFIGEDSFIQPTYSTSASPIVVNGGSVTLTESSAATVVAPEASTVIKVNGGNLFLNGQPTIEASDTATLVDVSGNGAVSGNGTRTEVHASRPSTSEVESVTPKLKTASETCADGDITCSVSCEAGTTVAYGSCGSTDGHPLASFGVDNDGSGYTCQWANAVPGYAPTSPTVTAMCR